MHRESTLVDGHVNIDKLPKGRLQELAAVDRVHALEAELQRTQERLEQTEDTLTQAAQSGQSLLDELEESRQQCELLRAEAEQAHEHAHKLEQSKEELAELRDQILYDHEQQATELAQLRREISNQRPNMRRSNTVQLEADEKLKEVKAELRDAMKLVQELLHAKQAARWRLLQALQQRSAAEDLAEEAQAKVGPLHAEKEASLQTLQKLREELQQKDVELKAQREQAQQAVAAYEELEPKVEELRMEKEELIDQVDDLNDEVRRLKSGGASGKTAEQKAADVLRIQNKIRTTATGSAVRRNMKRSDSAVSWATDVTEVTLGSSSDEDEDEEGETPKAAPARSATDGPRRRPTVNFADTDEDGRRDRRANTGPRHTKQTWTKKGRLSIRDANLLRELVMDQQDETEHLEQARAENDKLARQITDLRKGHQLELKKMETQLQVEKEFSRQLSAAHDPASIEQLQRTMTAQLEASHKELEFREVPDLGADDDDLDRLREAGGASAVLADLDRARRDKQKQDDKVAQLKQKVAQLEELLEQAELEQEQRQQELEQQADELRARAEKEQADAATRAAEGASEEHKERADRAEQEREDLQHELQDLRQQVQDLKGQISERGTRFEEMDRFAKALSDLNRTMSSKRRAQERRASARHSLDERTGQQLSRQKSTRASIANAVEVQNRQMRMELASLYKERLQAPYAGQLQTDFADVVIKAASAAASAVEEAVTTAVGKEEPEPGSFHGEYTVAFFSEQMEAARRKRGATRPRRGAAAGQRSNRVVVQSQKTNQSAVTTPGGSETNGRSHTFSRDPTV